LSDHVIAPTWLIRLEENANGMLPLDLFHGSVDSEVGAEVIVEWCQAVLPGQLVRQPAPDCYGDETGQIGLFGGEVVISHGVKPWLKILDEVAGVPGRDRPRERNGGVGGGDDQIIGHSLIGDIGENTCG